MENSGFFAGNYFVKKPAFNRCLESSFVFLFIARKCTLKITYLIIYQNKLKKLFEFLQFFWEVIFATGNGTNNAYDYYTNNMQSFKHNYFSIYDCK